jgi:oryzin
LNAAINSAYSSGVLTIVAAGNDDIDATNVSPASAAKAFTVGALDTDWSEASFSNYGKVLDIYAPGKWITSSWIGSADAKNQTWGTSVATPHVTGLALYLMELENLNTPSAVTSRIKELATRDKITNIGDGSPNLILYNGNGA